MQIFGPLILLNFLKKKGIGRISDTENLMGNYPFSFDSWIFCVIQTQYRFSPVVLMRILGAPILFLLSKYKKDMWCI